MFRIVEAGGQGDVPEKFLDDLRKRGTKLIL